MEVRIVCAWHDAVAAGSPEPVARNNHYMVAFDAAADESVICSFRMPATYNSGANLTGTLTMFAATATTGTVRARLEFEYVPAGSLDIDADSFDAAVEANATADATSGESFTASFTLANADIDAPVAGAYMRVKITRVGTDGTNDTMTGDAQFLDLVLSQ